jgi:hypothetical protein
LGNRKTEIDDADKSCYTPTNVKSQAALRRVRVGRRILNGAYLAVATWVVVSSVWQITVATFALGEGAKGAATAETVGPACAKALFDYRTALEGAWNSAHANASTDPALRRAEEKAHDTDGLAERYRAALAPHAATQAAVATTCRNTPRGSRAELVLARLASGQLLAADRASAFPLSELRDAVSREIPAP